MKKLTIGALCALGILGSGCDLEIPTEAMGQLTISELCLLSGGQFDENTMRCTCGESAEACDKNITCTVDEDTNKYVCKGKKNVDDAPQYTCTLKGMTICFDHIINTTDKDGNPITRTSGYFVTCDGTSWSASSPCENGYSCSTYLERDVFYATRCGQCINDGTTCVRGTKKIDDAE